MTAATLPASQEAVLLFVVVAFAWNLGAHYTGATMGMPYASRSVALWPALAVVATFSLLGATFASGRVEQTVGLHLISARQVTGVTAIVIVASGGALTMLFNYLRLPTSTAQQQAAVADLLAHDGGVLIAPPGTGKTVIACALIAERKLPTLILAHSKPLLEQWREQLQALLGLPAKQIGQHGGGRRKRTGIIDLAMIQSLKAIDELEQFFGGYGLVVVDECHHLPAFSFESAIRRAPVRHVLGLTATPYRRDGLQEIITMQCGPVRHEIAPGDGPAREIDLRLDVRETQFAVAGATERPIHELFRLLVEDEERGALVCDDVIGALAQGRRCLVLTQWKAHCRLLADGLQKRGVSPFVLEGGLGKRARVALLNEIELASPNEPLVVIATGQYVGEGFDCPQLDTLFLAFPLSFKGRLVQYTGRLMRAYENKTSVRVYDYADLRVPVLRAMHIRRLATYKKLGFTADLSPAPPTRQLAVPILAA